MIINRNKVHNLNYNYLISELMFFIKNTKLNCNSIAIMENIFIVFPLFLSLVLKFNLLRR
jgi:hypothetical protein